MRYLILLFLFISLPVLSQDLPEIMVIHGFSATPRMHSAELSPVTREYINAGFNVYVARTPRFDNLESHADRVVAQMLEDIEPGKVVHLNGHSQGGLVARLVAHKFNELPKEVKQGRRIQAVVTIGTPHRGASNITNPIAERAAFNEKYPNLRGIQYASISNIDPKTMRKAETSDGLISTNSSRWGVEIKIDGKDPLRDHLSQVYNLSGEKAATDNGLALVEYATRVSEGRAPRGKTFNFTVPADTQYLKTPQSQQLARALQCLLD